MLKIRLQRVGRKHEPSFRLVLTESVNSTKSGRFKEVLGSYDPRKTVDALNTERLQYWLSKGASATGSVHNLLVTHKVINAPKINVAVIPKKAPVAEPVAETPTPAPTPNDAPTETPAPEVVPEAPTPAPENIENAKIEEAAEETPAA